MKTISIIRADIESQSPLFISDGNDILMDEETGRAYLPATTVAGAFRAYLKSIGEDYENLFGCQVGKKSIMSKVYISDSYANITSFERRDGVRINSKTGSNIDGGKIERLYLGQGLKFQLKFEIHGKNNKKFKDMIYKCLRALEKSIIRFGGNKSNGLGVFHINRVENVDFNLKDKNQWQMYLKNDYSGMKDVKSEVLKSEPDDRFVEFIMKGDLVSPLLIKAPDTYDPDDVDDRSIRSGENFIIPGSSFKGIIRSRIETIANYFDNIVEAKEIFGDIKTNGKENILSRVFVNEAIVDNRKFNEQVKYNRIKIDKFTGGIRNSALMDNIPVQGNIEFKIIYKKQNVKEKDYYAIGIISLALRDLGTENLTLGGGNNIGRGRFKASSMTIKDGKEKIEIDFYKKTILNEKKINDYIDAVRTFKCEEVEKCIE